MERVWKQDEDFVNLNLDLLSSLKVIDSQKYNKKLLENQHVNASSADAYNLVRVFSPYNREVTTVNDYDYMIVLAQSTSVAQKFNDEIYD